MRRLDTILADVLSQLETDMKAAAMERAAMGTREPTPLGSKAGPRAALSQGRDWTSATGGDWPLEAQEWHWSQPPRDACMSVPMGMEKGRAELANAPGQVGTYKRQTESREVATVYPSTMDRRGKPGHPHAEPRRGSGFPLLVTVDGVHVRSRSLTGCGA